MEREISIILKVKGAAAAKKAVNDVFNNEVLKKAEQYGLATKKGAKSTEALGNSAKRASSNVSGFTRILGRGMAAIYLYNRAWTTFGKNFESGMELDRASAQFNSYVGNVNEMLPVLRNATQGVIADFDLLKTANKAFQQGIKPQQMGHTFKLATVAAQRLGLSATDSINTVTNAITKQDEGALNTLGIVTKVNQAYKTQAAMIAKNGGVMSQAMSIQLRQNLIMKELNSRFGQGNAIQADGLQVLERFRASWKNFRAEIGRTIGIALIPLTRALTGVLDMTTRFLEKMNKTQGFQRFVQIAATLGGIWAGTKFISGARALMGLLGSFQSPALAKGLAFAANTFSKIGSRMAFITRFIPGWGTALSAILLFLNPVVDGLAKAWQMGKVFFQLLSNYDPSTGLSKVLKEDADKLGQFYNWVDRAAKATLLFGAALEGIGNAFNEAFSPVGSVLGWANSQLRAFGIDLFTIDKTASLTARSMTGLTNNVKEFVKYLGFGASMLAMFVPGLQTMGLAGASLFGGAILNDMGMGNALSQMATPSDSASTTPQWYGNSGPAMGQTSTQMETPTPRAMNLDYESATDEAIKKIAKGISDQTEMMRKEVQDKQIEKSQDRAGTLYRR